MATYNIPALFQSIHGINYVLNGKPSSSVVPYSKISTLDEPAPAEQHGTSSFGTLIHDVVILKDADGNQLQLPDVMLFDVAQAKVILRTPVQGNDGTVKEYITLDDYQVTFRGLFVNEDGSFAPPDNKVKAFMTYWKKGEALQVICQALNDVYGIYNLVLTDVEFMQADGVLDSLGFRLNAISDEPAEVTIKKLLI